VDDDTSLEKVDDFFVESLTELNVEDLVAVFVNVRLDEISLLAPLLAR